MQKHKLISVCYCFECGNENLPHLADLISETEDEYKSLILAYLRENCIACSTSSSKRDIINNEKTAGCGDLYCDDKYIWDDNLIYYIREYNIKLPDEFRRYILENYVERKKKIYNARQKNR